MLEDYCQKLQQLNKDKNNFLKLKYKTSAKSMIDKQENKYHKYILGQISHKNKLDSLLKMTQAFNRAVRKSQRPFFTILLEKYIRQKENDQSISTVKDKNERNFPKLLESSRKEDSVIISNLKSKLINYSCNSLVKILNSNHKYQISEAFKLIKYKKDLSEVIERLFNIIERKIAFQKSNSFHNLLKLKGTPTKNSANENNHNKSFIFSLNEFSEIIPYTIEEESDDFSTSGMRNIEEIDNKFQRENEQKLSETNLLQSQVDEHKLLMESFEKLKEEVFMMKNLLSEKNKQLKSKDEEIYKTKKEYEKKIENLHDEISSQIEKELLHREENNSKSSLKDSKKMDSHNDSYLKELEGQVIGDRNLRCNVEVEENVNSQLLQKYMKESFEMREKMDMARELCEQFEFDNKTQEGQVMIEIIKLLTPEERLNVIVD